MKYIAIAVLSFLCSCASAPKVTNEQVRQIIESAVALKCSPEAAKCVPILAKCLKP